MESIATLRHVRLSVRKARVVANLVRGRDVAEALNLLRFTRKAAAPVVGKLLDSAIANARQKNENVDLDRLYIKLVYADQAPLKNMRRWRPRAQGRATRINKGVSHITVVLAEREA